MSERHPIDELFSRTLHDAEVTPPPAVWLGILRERAKRRGGYWGWLVAALVTVGGASAIWFSVNRTPTVLETAYVPTSAPSSVPNTSAGATATTAMPTLAGQSNANLQVTLAEQGKTMSLPGDAGNTGSFGAPEHVIPFGGPTRHASTGTGGEVANSVGTTTAPATTRSSNVAVAPRSSTDPRASEDHLELLMPRVPVAPTRPIEPDSLRTREKPLPYVLSNADWWVALEVGRFDERRTWYGTDEPLVSGLNDTEVPHYTWSVGALAGRSWRGGFGVSLGTAYEASEQSFHFTGPSTVQDGVQYFPYLVTLDTQVFISNMDTVPTYTTQQKQTNATNRFSAVRVSAEGYWHATYRRWTFGPRLGLGTEFMTMRDGYTLDGASDTALVPVDLSASDLNARYATTLTGLIGADVGFALNEHWGLWATPSYFRGLATWGSGDAPYMLPERLGLRLRVSYTFTKIP